MALSEKVKRKIISACPNIYLVLEANCIKGCVSRKVCEELAKDGNIVKATISKFIRQEGYRILGFRQHQVLELSYRGYTPTEISFLLRITLRNCTLIAKSIEELL